MKTTMSQEDYLETIYDLSQNGKSVRSVDVARIRNVSRASINKAIARLVEGNYIEHEKYGALILTAKGKRIAREVRKRHNILRNFLEHVLKVQPASAEEEACKIEHVISHETVNKLCQYVSEHAGTVTLQADSAECYKDEPSQ